MALAVRKISASATLIALMWAKAAGPTRRALEQFGDETANPPASQWPGIFMRNPGSLGVGFLFMLFSQAFGDRHFILLRANALRRIAMIRRAKQDALRSFSEGGPPVYYVYLIESISAQGERYVGMTTDLKQRLQQHNAGKSFHTSKFKPWEVENVYRVY
jgi:GIY-YIG catalytic domain